MEQIKRIEDMEKIMYKAEKTLSELRNAIEQYKDLQNEIGKLEKYYESDLWRKDFDDDCCGKLPQDLKRGVLSEDGIWNILIERDSLLYEMKNIVKDICFDYDKYYASESDE